MWDGNTVEMLSNNAHMLDELLLRDLSYTLLYVLCRMYWRDSNVFGL